MRLIPATYFFGNAVFLCNALTSGWLVLALLAGSFIGTFAPATGEALGRWGVPLTVTLGVRNLLDETYRDFLDTYKGYALSPGRDVQFSLSTSF